MSRRLSAKLILIALAVVTVIGGVLCWDPLYWHIKTKPFFWEKGGLAGYKRVLRSSPNVSHGRSRLWRRDSGMIAMDRWYENGVRLRMTYWNKEGVVEWQRRQPPGGRARDEEQFQPPWWWGATDQTAPSMPEWMRNDDKWRRVLDAQD